MKTKYIVSGGSANEPNELNDHFFREILKDTPSNPKVLLVMFAKTEDKVEARVASVKKQFEKNKGNKQPTFTLANHGEFESQLQETDIVYLHGGTTLLLIDAISKHPNFKELIKGKVVAGESAGAYLLSTKFYSKTIGKVMDGLGLLTIKTICHYEDRNQEKLKDKDGLELLLLRDYEHKVFYS